MSDPVIEIHGLEKSFGTTRALAGLDLAVTPGEVHGFLGPNGAGKSTTLRILLGLVRRDAGQVRLFGSDAWAEAAELHRRLAYVPGDVSLWPNLSGGEVIDMLLRMRGAPVDHPLRAQMVERFELDLTKKGRAYSKGNRQKVALVAAFAAPTDLLVLDEPTAGLDPLMEQVFAAVHRRRPGGRHHGAAVEPHPQRGRAARRPGHDHPRGPRGRDRDARRHAPPPPLPRARRDRAAPRRTCRASRACTTSTVEGDTVTCTVGPEALPAVLAALTTAGVRALTSTPPTLEELFLDAYRRPGEEAVR